ncbi:hypothetical protein MLD38_033607 [Melastoma candidum]|uniref:Uncharacterized protein n=1 Tax=Melastoma candidum TaxID=119954 RepID=A0ACB9M7T2_9MYRT|nr:hypothetical protein MLD38_033607 [Melastoma candidum]
MSSDKKNPGILNLNAPLLSTRRPFFPSRQRLSTSSRPLSPPPPHQCIPFSWELTPGLPKLIDCPPSSDSFNDYAPHGGFFTPRPRPPPGRYLSSRRHIRRMSLCDRDELDDASYYCCYDNPTSRPDSLSASNINAVDTFSLSEAIDALEKAEVDASDSNPSALKRMAETAEGSSPSFMINRFLPDANALAASSALRYYSSSSSSWNNKTRRQGSQGSYSSRDEGDEEGEVRWWSSKACGMERVLQWGMKPRLCGDSSRRRSPMVVRPLSILGGNRRSKPSS